MEAGLPEAIAQASWRRNSAGLELAPWLKAFQRAARSRSRPRQVMKRVPQRSIVFNVFSKFL